MRTYRKITPCAALAALFALGVSPGVAQQLTGAPASPGLKFSTPMPPGVASPDTVEPRFGTLHFFDGVPDKASTEKIYDNLDYQRAVQAYLLALPVVNQAANRAGTLDIGPCQHDGFDMGAAGRFRHCRADRQRQHALHLVLDRSAQRPAGVDGDAEGARLVTTFGTTGRRHRLHRTGPGGEFLMPPATRERPEGFSSCGLEVQRLGGWRRRSEARRGPRQEVHQDLSALRRQARRLNSSICPATVQHCRSAGSASGRCSIEVVQSEPTESMDPTTLGFWASIGIRKGKPFAPDARMKKILTEAAAAGDATARALGYRDA